MVQVVDVESESQSGMLSGTANGRATTIWEPRRCRGKVLEDCRTASERATRRKDVRCVRRGRRRKSAFPIVRVHIEKRTTRTRTMRAQQSGDGTASVVVVAAGDQRKH
jgi:hypothetical protein